MKRKAEQGFSYVEILMAALLLGLFFVPVVTGFTASARNLKFADAAYRAGLCASNLLLEAGRGIRQEHFDEAPDLKALTGNVAFDDEYCSDEFDYALTAVELNAEGRVMYLSTGEHIAEPPEFSGTYLPERAAEGVELRYNGSFEHVRGDGVVIESDDLCRLNVSGGAEIHFEGVSGPVEIVVEGETTSLLIFTEENVDRELINISGVAAASVLFLDEPPIEYLLVAEVYSKAGDVLASVTSISGGGR